MLTTLTLSGLHCDACIKLISKRLSKLQGVRTVQVELSGKTQIEADRVIEADEVQAALADTEYTVQS
ncbi:MAG: hypothetical protein ACD_28C00180G0004 [uncultured bacterium]|nr:MAG: hypothetical protein ACD_28C00180G0004 [uncultured bacterium]